MLFSRIDLLDFFLLPIVFFVGIVISREDFLTGKIRNKWIIFGLIYGIAIFTMLYLLSRFTDLLGSFNLTSVYLARVNYNSILALALGFWLWKIKLLSAGDAKLFFLFSFLLPLKYYWASYFPLFPSFVLAINILMPIFIFILLQTTIYWLKRLIRPESSMDEVLAQKVKKSIWPEIINLIKLLVVILAASILIQRITGYIASFWPSAQDSGLLLIGIFLLFRPLQQLIKKYREVIYLSLVIISSSLVYGYMTGGVNTLSIFWLLFSRLILFFLGYFLLNKFLQSYLSKTSVITVHLNDLKPGMRLAEKNKFFDEKNSQSELDQENLGVIKNWAEKEGKTGLRVYRKQSFAVWIFLGVIITIVLQKSLLSVIIDLW